MMRRAGLVALAALACNGADARPPSAAERGATVAAASAQASATRQTAITRAVARVAPAVVSVQTEQVERVPIDAFEQFLGGRSGERVAAGIGTGFVTRADGIVVTNAHVIAGASRVMVAMRDGQSFQAEVLGADETNDLAVLRIPAKDLPIAPLGDSESLIVGEWVIAIGNPYGFVIGNTEPTVTAGVISATGRNLMLGRESSGAYLDLVQTDASINPGNSGGPLVNADGEVIGVNSSIYSPSGGSVGIGFAIPINRAKHVIDDLIRFRAVRRAWVGVRLVIPRTTNPLELTRTTTTVAAVTPGSPAAKAGLRAGDVLTRAGNRRLRNPLDWDAALLDFRVGEPIEIGVQRPGGEAVVRVTPTDLPEVTAPKVAALRELELVTLTPAIRAERQIRVAQGAVIYRVSDRMREALGLEPGDVIAQINRTTVSDAQSAARALDYYGDRGPIRLFFERSGRIYATDFTFQ